MKVKIYFKDQPVIEHEDDHYIIIAEPNANGDLIVYRDHLNLLERQPIASYAAGGWVKHESR